MNLIYNIFQKLKTLKYLLFLSPADREFIYFSKEKWKSTNNYEYEGEILVDQMFYDIYIFELSYISCTTLGWPPEN